MNLVQRLAEQASEFPGRIAIIDSGASITYEDLWNQISRGAGYLHHQGLRKGDYVLILHPVSIKLYELLLSCLHAGLTVILIDPAKGIGFLNDCLKRYPPAAFLASPKAHLLQIKSSALRKIPLKLHTGKLFPFAKFQARSGRTSPVTSVSADTPALLTFTSGSTGHPKAVARSHQFLLAQDSVLSRSLNLKPGQVDLVTLPVFLLANLSNGLTSVIADTNLARPGSPDVSRISTQCRNHQVTRCTASPAFFEALPPHLFREVYTGGAPVFPDLLDKLPKNTHLVYGSSEAEPISHFSARDFTPEILAIIKDGGGLPAGQVVEEIKLAIIEDQTGQPLPKLTPDEFSKLQRERGEIVVSGSHVLSGYLGGFGDSENKISVDGQIWHRTGDAGRQDENGHLWLLGRCQAKWRNYYPLQIEASARAFHPGIKCAFWKGLLILESRHSQLESQLESQLKQFDLKGIMVIDKIPMDSRHNAKVHYPSLEKLLRGKSENHAL